MAKSEVDDAAFQRALLTRIKVMESGAASALTAVGIAAVNGAKRRCPVDTGRLRASYVSSPRSDVQGPMVEVGSDVNYASYVEFGTSRQSAQPHFRPAIEEAVRRLPALLVQHMSK